MKKNAFSLVELSIVLVILGLLTGGVLGGQSLIRAAQLRAVNTEYTRYATAMNTFRDKYFALPGDIPNAHQFWGARDGGNGYGNDCRLETTATATCSGNGNGRIIGYDGVDPDASSYTYEMYLIWDHLAKAGLIEGTYGGMVATAPANTVCIHATEGSIPGCNVPRSKIASNGMWQIAYWGTLTGHSYLFDGSYQHALFMSVGPGWQNPLGGLLTPEEVWNIDTKVDDGRPATGNLVVSRWNGCTNGAVSTANPGPNEYWLNPPSWALGNRCIPVYRNLF